MADLQTRIALMVRLGQLMQSEDGDWMAAKEHAVISNAWFTEEYVSLAISNICTTFLQEDELQAWAARYTMPASPKTVGIVMAGNIPLVGFHDFLCAFICGHKLMLKLSSKDEVLLKFLLSKLYEWEPSLKETIVVADILRGCDAYIATGSNNSSRYFEQYFARFPSIIRRNRTSVAILDGTETADQLQELSRDVFTYFGLGCRNVTQICVPENYDFTQLLTVFKNHEDMMLHHKYKNNYDYHLALYLLNAVPYKTNEALLMVENAFPFSAVSVLHYRFYQDQAALLEELKANDDIQCVVGAGAIPFGGAQIPQLDDYADGVDTMSFLSGL